MRCIFSRILPPDQCYNTCNGNAFGKWDLVFFKDRTEVFHGFHFLAGKLGMTVDMPADLHQLRKDLGSMLVDCFAQF